MVRRTLLLAAVGAHLLLTAGHGLVHVAIPVFPTGWQAALAGALLYLLPVAGAGLATTGYRRAGAAVLVGAGVAGFGFEGAFHFLLANPDHVAAHRTAFGVTAALTTASDLLLVGAGLCAVQMHNSR